jgi:hypothetical protein
MIHCLKTDPGIQQSVPILVNFIAERFRQFFKDCKTMQAVLSVYDALLQNSELDLTPFAHKIVPILLTTILSKNLRITSKKHSKSYLQCASYTLFEEVREKAVETLTGFCCYLNQSAYNFEARCLQTLIHQVKNAATCRLDILHGSILGISKIGGFRLIRHSLLRERLLRRLSDEKYHSTKWKGRPVRIITLPINEIISKRNTQQLTRQRR